MRIALVCPYSLSVPGGVQTQVLGLARVQRGLGHEVRVLAPCDGPPPELFVTPLGNSMPTAANGSMAPLAPDFAASLRTMRSLRDEEFDIVHIHEPLAPGPTLTALLMHPAPTVATFHAAGESPSYRWLNLWLKRYANRIDVRCAVSDDARALAQRYLGGHYELVFNGVEVDRWRRAEPLKPDGPTVFFCGRHEPRKGLDVLLAAMASLPPTTRCWVAGTGPDTMRLQAQYAGDPRIEWLGRITDEEKTARMRGADVFCAPSLRGESFGVVLIEAMAARTPIVATDLPGYRNVARPDQDAVLVPVGDAEALGAALRSVLTDDELAERLRSSGAQRAEHFSMERLAHRYLEWYETLHQSELGRQMAERVRSRRGRRRNIPST
jgi:phosphatidylinositol alpha-mannosyltransferase